MRGPMKLKRTLPYMLYCICQTSAHAKTYMPLPSRRHVRVVAGKRHPLERQAIRKRPFIAYFKRIIVVQIVVRLVVRIAPRRRLPFTRKRRDAPHGPADAPPSPQADPSVRELRGAAEATNSFRVIFIGLLQPSRCGRCIRPAPCAECRSSVCSTLRPAPGGSRTSLGASARREGSRARLC